MKKLKSCRKNNPFNKYPKIHKKTLKTHKSLINLKAILFMIYSIRKTKPKNFQKIIQIKNMSK